MSVVEKESCKVEGVLMSFPCVGVFSSWEIFGERSIKEVSNVLWRDGCVILTLELAVVAGKAVAFCSNEGG